MCGSHMQSDYIFTYTNTINLIPKYNLFPRLDGKVSLECHETK